MEGLSPIVCIIITRGTLEPYFLDLPTSWYSRDVFVMCVSVGRGRSSDARDARDAQDAERVDACRSATAVHREIQ